MPTKDPPDATDDELLRKAGAAPRGPGPGAVESAHRHVLQRRMKLAGPHGVQGAGSVIRRLWFRRRGARRSLRGTTRDKVERCDVRQTLVSALSMLSLWLCSWMVVAAPTTDNRPRVLILPP